MISWREEALMAIAQSERELTKGRKLRAYLESRGTSISWLGRNMRPTMEHGQLSRLLGGTPTAEGGFYHWNAGIESRIAVALGVTKSAVFGRDRSKTKS
jgi:hypothetical protein